MFGYPTTFYEAISNEQEKGEAKETEQRDVTFYPINRQKSIIVLTV
jgi:hypothetical protein